MGSEESGVPNGSQRITVLTASGGGRNCLKGLVEIAPSGEATWLVQRRLQQSLAMVKDDRSDNGGLRIWPEDPCVVTCIARTLWR